MILRQIERQRFSSRKEGKRYNTISIKYNIIYQRETVMQSARGAEREPADAIDRSKECAALPRKGICCEAGKKKQEIFLPGSGCRDSFLRGRGTARAGAENSQPKKRNQF